MKSFRLDLDALLTIAAGVLDAKGVLLEANAGFLRLLPAEYSEPIGMNVAACFIQPPFAALALFGDDEGTEGYRGLITIGDGAGCGTARTLRGRAWRNGSGIRVLAEYDIEELEKLTEGVLQLNREYAVAQHDLARANLALKLRQVQTLEVSLTDALTGLGNRRRLDQALATEISRVRRTGGTMSAIMADIDHFKLVNDKFGHGAGDRVLAHLAATLRANTRSTDIVTRLGGEEFVVIMPHTDLEQAALKAELLRGRFAAEAIAPIGITVTSSFGVAELLPGEGGESFLNRLDAALYRAKEDGRNTVRAAACTPPEAIS